MEQKNLEIARNLVSKVLGCHEVKVYLMKNAEGKAGNPIKLDRSILKDTSKTISTVVHEMTHVYYGCEDMTANMIHLLTDMSAMILLPYLRNEFSTKILCSSVTNGNVQYRVSIPKNEIETQNIHKGERVTITITKEESDMNE